MLDLGSLALRGLDLGRGINRAAGTYRTVIGTRNGIPIATSTPAAAATNGATMSRHQRRNNTTATARNLAARVFAFGFDANLKCWPTGGQVERKISATIGGTRYQLKQNGSSTIVIPAGGWVDIPIVDGSGNPLSLGSLGVCIFRDYVDQTIGKYGSPLMGGNVLAGLGEYSTFGGTGAVTDMTMTGDRTAASGPAAIAIWLIGDVPFGTMTAVTVDDSKGRGIIECGNTGNNADYGVNYTGDDFGNAGYWDRTHRVIGVNGLNLSMPSSSATGNGSSTGWAYNADVDKLTNVTTGALAGLKFSAFTIGLGENENVSTLATLKTSYGLILAKFAPFLLPGAKIVCRELTPSAKEAGRTVTSTTYSGTTGVDTIATADAAALSAALALGLTHIKKTGANQAGFVGVFPIVSVDTGANTVSYTVASGLTTPTTFGLITSLYSTGQFQTIPNATYEGYRLAKLAEVQAKTMLPGQTGVLYTLASVEVTFGSNKVWRFDGIRQRFVADGVHETAYAYDIIANANPNVYA